MISHEKEVLASQNESARNELYWVWDKSYCLAMAVDVTSPILSTRGHGVARDDMGKSGGQPSPSSVEY
jgi:hypothetical protein